MPDQGDIVLLPVPFIGRRLVKPFPLILGALCILCAASAAVRADTDDGKAKKAIQQVLDAQQAAWNKGDLEGFMTGYWKSDDLSFYSGGDKTKGWQATLERYQKKYQGEGKEM